MPNICINLQDFCCTRKLITIKLDAIKSLEALMFKGIDGMDEKVSKIDVIDLFVVVILFGVGWNVM